MPAGSIGDVFFFFVEGTLNTHSVSVCWFLMFSNPETPDPSRSSRIDGGLMVENSPSPGHRIGSGKSRILRTYKRIPSFFSCLGGGFKHLLFSPLPGEKIQFDAINIFQMGWFDHQIGWVSQVGACCWVFSSAS